MPLFQTASQCTTNQGARLQRPSAYRPTGTPLVPLSKSSIFLPRTDRSSKSTIGSLKRAYLKQALSSFMFGTKNVQLHPIIARTLSNIYAAWPQTCEPVRGTPESVGGENVCDGMQGRRFPDTDLGPRLGLRIDGLMDALPLLRGSTGVIRAGRSSSGIIGCGARGANATSPPSSSSASRPVVYPRVYPVPSSSATASPSDPPDLLLMVHVSSLQ